VLRPRVLLIKARFSATVKLTESVKCEYKQLKYGY